MNATMVVVVGILAATALLSGHLTAYMAVRSRGARSALVMAMIMGGTAWWAALNALEYLAPGLELKIVFANLQYIAIAGIPCLWFSLGSYLDQEERSGTARRSPLVILIVPLVTAVLVWTDQSLGLVRHSFRLGAESGFTVIDKQFGPWFWVHSAYSYLFIIIGTVLIIRALRVTRGIRRAQRITLVIGTLLPVCANLAYLAGIFPLASVDPTPLAFSLTGLLAVLNLSRFRFLALVTTAQATAIEQLRDPVLILDRDGSLVYANAAARGSFATVGRDIGGKLAELGAPFSDLPWARESAGDARPKEHVVSHGERRYEARIAYCQATVSSSKGEPPKFHSCWLWS